MLTERSLVALMMIEIRKTDAFVVITLAGGDKESQPKDIKIALHLSRNL